VKIYDCRKKEVLLIEKKGGDLELRIEDMNGNTKFLIWFEMKTPWMKTYREIEKLFQRLKELLKGQEEEDEIL